MHMYCLEVKLLCYALGKYTVVFDSATGLATKLSVS
jgi:hypothetical protein